MLELPDENFPSELRRKIVFFNLQVTKISVINSLMHQNILKNMVSKKYKNCLLKITCTGTVIS